MAISISRYVNVTSALGGVSQIGQRSLGGLIVSLNPLIPSGTFLTFSNAAAVGTYFGTASNEYLRAAYYFSFISKQGTQPQSLSFWFWNNNAATSSLIYGAVGTYAVSQFTGITSGGFTLTLGGYTATLSGINLSGAGSLTAVASSIQTAIRAVSAGSTPWTGATVSFDATNNRFNLVGGGTGADSGVAVVAGATNDVAGLLGWLPSAATVPVIISNGTAAQSLTANLTQLASTNNNFGSFVLGTASINTQANVTAAASWNYSLSPNVQFLYSWNVSAANVATWQAAVSGFGGHCGTIASPVANEFPEMQPMATLAATDYTAQNSVQNFMFQQSALTPSVTTDAGANTYDALKLNYYGNTQTNGQIVSFYQRGVISGGQPVDAQLINIYANEIWLKSAMSTSFMNLLLALSQVSANNQGRAQLVATGNTVIQQALFNGTISVGNALSTTQQLYITNATGDPTAWRKVQTLGWWFDVEFQTVVISGVTQYQAIYTLIYAKDNVINRIQGTDILI